MTVGRLLSEPKQLEVGEQTVEAQRRRRRSCYWCLNKNDYPYQGVPKRQERRGSVSFSRLQGRLHLWPDYFLTEQVIAVC